LRNQHALTLTESSIAMPVGSLDVGDRFIDLSNGSSLEQFVTSWT
jgi:hypothetical protein